MPSANTLLSICIAQYYPDQMMRIIETADKHGYDFSFIEQNIAKFNTTLQEMDDYNKRYEPWWGMPYKVVAFTTNKPDGGFVRMQE